MGKTLLVTTALILAGQFIAAPAMKAVGIKDSDGFGLDDVVEAGLLAGAVVFGRKLMR